MNSKQEKSLVYLLCETKEVLDEEAIIYCFLTIILASRFYKRKI